MAEFPMSLRSRCEALIESWGGDALVVHVIVCQDFSCKTCVVAACAADLQMALEGPDE